MIYTSAIMKHQLIFLSLLLAMALANTAAAEDQLTRKYFVAVRSQLDVRAQAALERVHGLGRQLLATRAYLRAGIGLDGRWSWTQQQIDAYAESPAQTVLDAQIAQVRAAFEKNNPGYSLYTNPQVRSLDLQLTRWNETASIAKAGEQMMADVSAAVRKPGFPAPGTVAGTARFRDLVTDYAPQPVPTLAAPGLSAHGRMNAVDFQVQRGDSIVAGPDSTTVDSVWIAQGWRDRLHAAVIASGTGFKGPLTSPVEPWHYVYVSP